MSASGEEDDTGTITRVNTADGDINEAASTAASQRKLLAPPSLQESWSGEVPIHEVFERLSTEQRRFFELVAKNLDFDTEEDIALIAERLLSKPEDAWALSEAAATAHLDRSLGREFLNSLLPWGSSLAQISGNKELISSVHFSWKNKATSTEVQWFAKPNLETAYDIFREWITMPDLYSLPEINYSTIRGTFEDLLDYQTQIFDPVEVVKDLAEDRLEESSICGVVGRISIDRKHGIIDHDTIATILCLGQGPRYWPYGGPQFLHAHLSEWSDKPLHATCRTRIFQSATCEAPSNPLNPGSHRYGVFMHYMRSFSVVDDFVDDSRWEAQSPPGLKCSREYISFEGFYGQGTIKLAERRYSTTLSMLPILRPLGHYILLSLIDTDQRTKDHDRNVWRGSPGFYDPVTNRTSPWKRYGLFPAGIHTGMAVFQLQICAFIESWEADWNDTIDHMDAMVSVKLHTLRDVRRLKTIILDSKADKSVLYFQVLQILRLFSDSIRTALRNVEALSQNVRKPASKDYWFEETYPHTKDTHRILEHNWGIVKRRQKEASDKLLTRLERTINEVKSLRDGLFSAQSVVEAQKTRILSKYLLVFTIVTIFFLPPTFVATLFGVDIFDLSSEAATQRMFWAVLTGVSSITYIIAALGLFGTSISSHERENLAENVKKMHWLRKRSSSVDTQASQDYSEADRYYAQ
ncbi:hypothetical protein HJFPF1_04209 [Paramyrothecium foliicola]|nr:hypothetical protein HJFPF1_04209 [Paramyrothecium foliicola]